MSSGRAAARARYRQKRQAEALAAAEYALAHAIYIKRRSPFDMLGLRDEVRKYGGDPYDLEHLKPLVIPPQP